MSELTQADISAEIAELDGRPGEQPRRDYPPYRSSLLRHPTKSLHHADPESVELWAPCFGPQDVGAAVQTKVSASKALVPRKPFDMTVNDRRFLRSLRIAAEEVKVEETN